MLWGFWFCFVFFYPSLNQKLVLLQWLMNGLSSYLMTGWTIMSPNNVITQMGAIQSGLQK